MIAQRLLAPRTLIVAFVAVLLICGVQAWEETYEELCQEIIKMGQQAAGLANSGDMRGALDAVQGARNVFAQAVKMEPANPQAYADIGVLLLNANMFNESIKNLEKALELIGPSEKPVRGKPPSPLERARMHFRSSIRRANYGYCSKSRDEAYKNGAGDVKAAYGWARCQLQYSEHPHRVHHDLGTLAVFLCEYNATMCTAAKRHFVEAATTAFQRYSLARASLPNVNSAANLQCIHSNRSKGQWTNNSKKVKTQKISEKISLHEIRGHKMMINGNDGVITFPQDAGDCTVLSPASDDYLDLGANLLPGSLLTGQRGNGAGDVLPRPMRRISSGTVVFSAVQFATVSFYHWLCEVIPRLVVASIYWDKWREAVVLIPEASNNRFMTQSLSLVFHDRVSLAEYKPYTEAEQLAFVQWDAPECPHPQGPCSALADPLALALARNELVRALRQSSWRDLAFHKPVIVFAARGSKVSMRAFDEEEFIKRLNKALEQRRVVAEVIVHNGDEMPFGQSLATFRQAAVVVGVHGGALSNIMACAPGTIVIEVGFTTAAARHYHHISRSLALDYRLVEVEQDALFRGLGAPTIAFDEERAISMVLEALPQAVAAKARYVEEFDRDTDPNRNARDDLEEERRIDREAEAFFNMKGSRSPGDGSGVVWEQHGGFNNPDGAADRLTQGNADL